MNVSVLTISWCFISIENICRIHVLVEDATDACSGDDDCRYCDTVQVANAAASIVKHSAVKRCIGA